MSEWLLFALLAPFFWGLTNVIDISLRRGAVKSDVTMTWLVSISRLLAVLFLLVFFPIQMLSDPMAVGGVLLAGLLWAVPLVLYFKALEHEEASRVALLFQFHPVFVLLIAFVFLGEQLMPLQLGAFLLILTGGFIAAVHRSENQWRLSSVFLLIILADLFWAMSDVLFKGFESSFPDYLSALVVFFFGSSLVSLSLLVFGKSRRTIVSDLKKLTAPVWGVIAIKSLLGLFAMGFFTYALTLGEASLTSVIGTTQPLFIFGLSILLGYFFLSVPREDTSKSSLILKSTSLVLIVMGVWMLG